LGELVEMSGERDRRERTQSWGHVRPGAVQQIIGRATTFGDRRKQALLALETMIDVSGDPLAWLPNRRAVSWAQHVEVALQQPSEGVEVARQGAGVGGNEHAALTQHRVPGEARAAHHQGIMIGRVPGRIERLEGTEANAVLQLYVGGAASACQRGREALA
jgi:hypothetical protein